MTKAKETPPVFAAWLLARIIRDEDRLSTLSDFAEIYEELAISRSYLSACRWYWSQVVRSIPMFILNYLYWGFIMFKNYLKAALRQMRRRKGFSILNISGLAIGIASSILILLWIHDEWSYDKFHKNADSICRVYSTWEWQPFALGPYMKNNYQEIENFVRISNRPAPVFKYIDKSFNVGRFIVVDNSFFKIFTFSFVKGNPETALNEPKSAVLTEETAKAYFGYEDPIGKVFSLNDQIEYQITGVVKNIPHNSTIKFDIVGSFSNSEISARTGNWGTHDYSTYVLLNKDADYRETIPRIADILSSKSDREADKLTLQPIRSIHLYEEEAIIYIYVFSLAALFILAMACINFINLSTASVKSRALEIGIRKVAGASRLSIARQFLGEAVILSFISFIFALIITAFVLPVFNAFLNKSLSLNIFNDPSLLAGLILLALLTGVTSGFYPAIFLSSFQPAAIFKQGSGQNKLGIRGSLLRKGLVLFQFSISLILIICTIIVTKQLYFSQNMDLGYNQENVVFFPLKGNVAQSRDTFESELLKNPNVLSMTLATSIPTNIKQRTSGISWEGQDANSQPSWSYVDTDNKYIETLGLTLKEGSNFRKEMNSIGTRVILNERAVAEMGMESPVGKRFSIWRFSATIIGVVKDYHFKSIHEEIWPLFIWSGNSQYWYMMIKVKPANETLNETLDHIKSVWEKFAPGFPFTYNFIDGEFEQEYKSELQMNTMFKYFTMLAVFISCLGIFGLSLFMAETRIKEISIRKVLGASVPNVVRLISKEFVVLVILSNFLAWPVAWYAMNKWLDSFAYHTNMSIEIFIISALLALVIAIVTVSFQSIKAAASNPVDSLRGE